MAENHNTESSLLTGNEEVPIQIANHGGVCIGVVSALTSILNEVPGCRSLTSLTQVIGLHQEINCQGISASENLLMGVHRMSQKVLDALGKFYPRIDR
jgi:hypothetical protein